MFKPGDAVVDKIYGPGVVHDITSDQDFPVIVKFKSQGPVNFYYSLEGKALNQKTVTLSKVGS